MKSHKFAMVIAALAVTATGCGSSGTTPAGSSAPGGTQQGSGATGQGGFGGPGGSGKVAAVSGSTAQVQNQSGQVAVSWTAKTTFSQEVATTAKALKVGDCVVAMPARSASSGSTAASSTVAAATVRISAPVSGSCAGGARFGAGRGPAGGPPSGAPSNAPNGGPRQGGRPGGFGAFGKVTALTGSGFTVRADRPTSPSGSSGSSSGTPTSTQVTTSAATTWSTTKKATAKAVTVGRCVNSVGQADSTGALAAVAITVSAPVGGQCAAGFGPRPGGQGVGQDSAQGQNP